MARVRALAFAKVNLFLAVGARRPDGYHDVDTVLQNIDLADVIELAHSPNGRTALETAGEHAVPSDQGNLCWRAAEAARDAWAPGRGLRISLTKAVPVGAGLGGGSSDAAAVLAAAQALWRVRPSPQEQAELAARLGSDVPFFLAGGTAAARGRGERIRPLSPAPPMWLVVGKPAASVATAWAYERLDAQAPTRRATSDAMQAALAEGDLHAIAAQLHNDLEIAVLPESPETARLKHDLMARGCLGALMAGSGSAVFGIAPDEDGAGSIARDLANRYPWVRVVRTCSQGVRVSPHPQELEHADA